MYKSRQLQNATKSQERTEAKKKEDLLYRPHAKPAFKFLISCCSEKRRLVMAHESLNLRLKGIYSILKVQNKLQMLPGPFWHDMNVHRK